jgi:predicted ATP-dependent serine protease
VIHGGQWPDGTPMDRIGNVVYVEAEAIPQVTNERAQALGINRHKLWLMMAENGELLDLTQPRWQDHLLDLATTVQPQLIVIDSLSSISSSGQNSVEDTNRLLMYLVALAPPLRLRAVDAASPAQAAGRPTQPTGH